MNREILKGARFACECGQRITFIDNGCATEHAIAHSVNCHCRSSVMGMSFPKPPEDMIYPDGSVEDGDAS